MSRWAASRSFLHLRQNAVISTSQRAFSHPFKRSYYLGQVRPSTWSARIWYRKDGTPRSKIKGLVISSIPTLIFAVLAVAAEIVYDLEETNLILRQLAHIQRLDTEFSSLDLADHKAVAIYFLSMCFLVAKELVSTDDHSDTFLIDLANHLPEEPEGEKFHTVAREAIEEVHRILVNSKGQDPSVTGVDVFRCLDKALVLATDIIDRAISRKNQDSISKDRALKMDEYDIVG